MLVYSKEGSKYFVTFTDECTGYLVAEAKGNKSEASNCLLTNVEHIERLTNGKARKVQFDGGSEYEKSSHALKAEGVVIDSSAPYISNENGRAEHHNRTMLNSMGCLLIHSGLPYSFWSEALQTVVDIRNQVPKQLNIISPFDELRRVRPSVTHLRIFGYRVYCRVADSQRHKL